MSSEDLEIPLLREPLERRPTFLATFSFRPSADINCSPIASATILQTSVIIVSIYVGLGLLSQPYAIHLGGWAALAALAGVAALFYTSASLLVSACDALPESAPKSLPHLGSVLWGRAGKSMVTFIAGLELFGSLAISLVVVFQQVELFLPTEGKSRQINNRDSGETLTSKHL